MKICTICKLLLDDELFHLREKGKRRSACIQCTNKRQRELYPKRKELHKKKMREHYAENKDEYSKRHAAYRRTDEGKIVHKAASKRFLETQKGRDAMKKSTDKYNAKNKEKLQSHWKVKQAIKTGALVRAPCEVCGELKVDAHHDDYTKPLEVRWLCRDHHKELHRKIIL